MDEFVGTSGGWNDGEFLEATSDPSVSIIAEDVPTMTVAAILGVTVVILIAIVMVFVLGVLIDCRQQRMMDKKKGESKRLKIQRRVNVHPEGDIVSITENMEEPGISLPPEVVLKTIP